MTAPEYMAVPARSGSLRIGVQGLGFTVQGLGFRGLGFRVDIAGYCDITCSYNPGAYYLGTSASKELWTRVAIATTFRLVSKRKLPVSKHFVNLGKGHRCTSPTDGAVGVDCPAPRSSRCCSAGPTGAAGLSAGAGGLLL